MAPRPEDLIIEFVPVGNSVKVSVFDPNTMTEVSIVGPRSASRNDLEQTALQKLRYVQEKERGKTREAEGQRDKGKKGIIV